MAWLWLVFPALVLALTAALWVATRRLLREQRALDGAVSHLRPAGLPPAAGPEQAHR